MTHRKLRGVAAVVVGAAVLLVGCQTAMDDTTGGTADGMPRRPLDAAAALARLKTLEGTFTVEIEGIPTPSMVSYDMVSGGHALLEKLNVGAPEEMVSLYYLEGEDLAMTHYCCIGNRPHLRLDRDHSTIDDLSFVFDGSATDIDPGKDAHIHAARFQFKNAESIDVDWTFWQDGAEAHRKTFPLSKTAGSFVAGQ